MKHLLHQIALRCSHFSAVHPCSTAFQAATYLLGTYKFRHRPTQRPNVSINSSRHNQLKKAVKICNPLTSWKKKNLYKLYAMFTFHVRLLLLTYLLSIEFDNHLKYWIYFWNPPIFYVMDFICYFSSCQNAITSCVASHDIIEIDSESSICCYHP